MSEQRQGSGEHRCQQCNQTFNSNEELRRHNEMQHDQGKRQGQGAGQGKAQGAGGRNR